jgi:hypothetical protein
MFIEVQEEKEVTLYETEKEDKEWREKVFTVVKEDNSRFREENCNLFNLPVEMKGLRYEVLSYAKNHNWKWVPSLAMLFGGYWRDSDGKTCYYAL